ncbi:Crp/Fnr family transcriptional regulator [Leuconostoc litchii]|uniref:Crp/Fnr family transcriptional regulator n=2 Tax=Leuconostoc litchii TaxID=1981069 RepID=A0A6P2CPJ6_9LACO|nr:Crp/Fnr family transcriptional regulator [Leuconostoc litchii]TYC46034.1 Crp/Fnr family transcriptional regulator [Leuconostoc litchii]
MNTLAHPDHNCISKTVLFSQLPQEELAMINQQITYVEYAPGEVVFDVEDDSDRLLLVHQGKLKISQTSSDGKEQTLYFLNEGDINGEESLITGAKHAVTCVAITKSFICEIRRSDFLELTKRQPNIGISLAISVAEKIQKLQAQQATLLNGSVEERLLAFLKKTAEESNSLTFNLPMSKKELAAYLGTIPATLSRNLSKLEEKQIISSSIKGKIVLNITKIDNP